MGAATPPLLDGRSYLTDGGLETDLIFNHGIDLPEFAAFPLVEDESGRETLAAYYAAYADLARKAGAGLVLESPTWRANPDWAAKVGYDAAALDRANREAVRFLHQERDGYDDLSDVLISGQIGPRGDGYVAGEKADPDEAAAYHKPQIESFAAAGADLTQALTMTGPEEAIGIVRAARSVGLPVGISFTVETDGRLPDGTRLADAVAQVEADGGPDHYLLNCAHPEHVLPGLADENGGGWRERIVGFRPNASKRTHQELDEAEDLDAGDPAELSSSFEQLRARLPSVSLLGGCCGTDARHVAALWGLA